MADQDIRDVVHAAERVGSDLPDLAGVDLRDLTAPAGSALDRALTRIRAELDSPQDAVAGFQPAS